MNEKCLYLVKRKLNLLHILGMTAQNIDERDEISRMWIRHLRCFVCGKMSETAKGRKV
jgi:hypothetical protein